MMALVSLSAQTPGSRDRGGAGRGRDCPSPHTTHKHNPAPSPPSRNPPLLSRPCDRIIRRPWFPHTRAHTPISYLNHTASRAQYARSTAHCVHAGRSCEPWTREAAASLWLWVPKILLSTTPNATAPKGHLKDIHLGEFRHVMGSPRLGQSPPLPLPCHATLACSAIAQRHAARSEGSMDFRAHDSTLQAVRSLQNPCADPVPKILRL